MRDSFKLGSQILDIPSTGNQRRFALLVALFIVIISLTAIPFGTKTLPAFSPFLPILISLFIFGDLLTAFFLFTQFRASGVPALLVLACTYVYAGLITALHILTFPGVFSENGVLGADSQTSAWMWVFWHAGFPTGILLYMYVGRRYRQSIMSKSDISFSAFIGLFITIMLVLLLFHISRAGSNILPALVDSEHSYWGVLSTGIGPFVALLNLIALIMMLVRFQARELLNLWISIALLALLFDIVLTIFAGTRYSFGWYLSRFNSVIAATIVLCAVVNEVNRMFVRLSDQHKELVESGKKLERVNQELLRLSILDSLTGIPNRRRLDEILSWELVAPEERRTPLSLLLLDIDRFKAYNDQLGHLCGDSVLKEVAEVLSEEAKRVHGFAARYGGEEFAVVLSGLDARDTYETAERIRAAVESLEIAFAGPSASWKVTVSIGGYCIPPFLEMDQDQFIRLADECLYEAKNTGRNRCIVKGWSGDSDFMEAMLEPEDS